MTMPLALAHFWKTLLNSCFKDYGEENVSVHKLLSPRFHCYVVGLVPPLLRRIEALVYVVEFSDMLLVVSVVKLSM
jgi:hypothetical protein